MDRQSNDLNFSLTQPPLRPRMVGERALPPDTLLTGRYRLRAIIGRGGMSIVYRAEDMRLGGRLVAIKEIVDTFDDPLEREQALEQFQQEGSLLATLDHPNLPHVSDYFSEGGRHYLVMELIEGRTLATIQREAGGGPLPLDIVMGWTRQICGVLEYLHDHRPPIIFRDLKPDNIMLDPQGRIKLIDFGIARLFDPAKRTDTLKMGTVGYAPPEQYSGRGMTDQRSDVYALGVTLYELLTGYDPATTPFALPPARKFNRAISPALNATLEKAVELDRRNRWQSVPALRDALFTAPLPQRPTRRLPLNNTVVTAQRVGFGGLLLGLLGLFVVAFIFIGSITLVHEIDSGTLRVYSDPGGADVLVDGRIVGVAPLEMPKLLAGNHTVELRSDRYEPWSQSIDLSRGDTVTVTATLLQKTGILVINGVTGVNNSVQASVEIDGKFAGTAPLRLGQLAPGTYHVRITAPHYKPFEQNVEVRWKETTGVSPTLEGLPGTITLQVTPPDAEIWIDSRPAPQAINGRVTITGVAPGTHDLRLQRTDYYRKSVTVEVNPDEQVSRKIAMDHLPGGTATLAYGRTGEQSHAGFLFSGGQVVPGNALNDFQFLVDSTLFNEVYKITTRDDRIAEMNETLDQIVDVPETISFNNTYAGPLQGRTFIVKTRDGKYAKIEILKVEPDWTEFRITFRWIYQPDGRSFK